jgi:Zinc-ribbon
MSGYYSHIDQLVALDEIPAQFANHVNNILCYDCGVKSSAPYHFVYHKCNPREGGCGGYNTRVLKTHVNSADGDSGHAPISPAVSLAAYQSSAGTGFGEGDGDASRSVRGDDSDDDDIAVVDDSDDDDIAVVDDSDYAASASDDCIVDDAATVGQ